MELRECYTSFGGDFDEVLGRLRREQLVEKFVLKFLADKSFQLFEESMEKKDYEDALRGVHTMKGICQNLSFTRLYESSNQVTQALKKGDYEKAVALTPQLSEDYYCVIHSIEEYKRGMEE